MEKKLKKHLRNGKFENVSFVRSKTMSAIKSKHNKTTEQRLRMVLVANRIKGWKLHQKELPGKPDFYFPRQKLAIFVDGCYWHGCPKCGHIPKTRTKFWKAKIERNKNRDRKVSRDLRKQSVTVLRFWEHQLASEKGIKKILSLIKKAQQT